VFEIPKPFADAQFNCLLMGYPCLHCSTSVRYKQNVSSLFGMIPINKRNRDVLVKGDPQR
jgi:hypothetical protein